MNQNTFLFILLAFSFILSSILGIRVKKIEDQPSIQNIKLLQARVKTLEDQTIFLNEKNLELLNLVSELSQNQKKMIKNHIILQEQFLEHLEE